MHAKTWRLKRPPQPLLFFFPTRPLLRAALLRLTLPAPGLSPHGKKLRLCRYRGGYYLSVSAALKERRIVRGAAEDIGLYLGPSPVLYAFFAEHGREIFP